MIIINLSKSFRFRLLDTVPVDHCFDHNKGCIRPHSYCVYQCWSLESAKVTACACTATGLGKGRSARQSWGLTKWPHSHWAEPNRHEHFIGSERLENNKISWPVNFSCTFTCFLVFVLCFIRIHTKLSWIRNTASVDSVVFRNIEPKHSSGGFAMSTCSCALPIQ